MLAAILLGLVFGAASGFGIPFFTEKVFKAIFEGREAVFGWSAGQAALLLPAIFLVRGIAGYGNQYYLNYCAQLVLQGLRRDLFAKFQELPLAYFEKQTSGDLMVRVHGDTTLLQTAILNLANDLVRQPVQLLGGLAFLIYLSITNREAVFLLLFVAIIPVIAWPVLAISRQLKRRSTEAQRWMGQLGSQLAENLNAVVEVRAFNLQERERRRMDECLAAYLRAQMKLTKYYTASQPLMELVGATVVSVSFYYAFRQGIGASTFLAMGAALYFCFDPLKRILKLRHDLERTHGALDRIEQVLREPATIEEPRRPRTISHWRGEIVFDRVSFAYAQQPVLHELSITIPAGTVCALVGRSGAGKTTFVRLLPRLYDIQSGSIAIDGVDLRQLRLSDLRGHIGLVPQQPVLFNDTVAGNIRLARPEATMDEVQAAARLACAEEFILRLPHGYETMIGEDGETLSGGQRQRLALARAFLKNAPILILDEATSALDSESEMRIQEALAALMQGKTVLVIAHRLSTVRRADCILVFDRGRIVGQGRHEELYTSNDLYRQLCELQNLS